MRLNIRTIEQLNELAHNGAVRAAQVLDDMTDTPTAVEVTRAELVQFGDLASAHQDKAVTGVSVSFHGDLEGSVVLVFEEDDIDTLVDALLPTSWDQITPEIYQSSLLELGNIMIGEFIDAWADAYGKQIQIQPPALLVGRWPAMLGPAASLWDDSRATLTFTSELQDPDASIEFDLYMFPAFESLTSLVDVSENEEAMPFSVDQFAAFTALMKDGAHHAAGKITDMTALETDVDISRITFVPKSSLGEYAPTEECIASVSELQEAPHGYIVFLFDRTSAIIFAEALLPGDDEATSFSDRHHNAIEELGNIMTSGLVDGWADTLGVSMLHNPPTVVERSGSDLLEELAVDVNTDHEYALLLDSTINLIDHDIQCTIFMLPNHEEFERLLTTL